MSDITLFDYWRSSASYRMRIALHMGGIEYTSVPVNLPTGEHRTPEHRARNPQGFVPVLDIDGARLTQSLAMLEYLNDTRKLGLLSDDPLTRARERALAHSLAVDIHPVCNLSVASHAKALTGDDETMGAWMRHFIRPGLEAFEVLLAGFDQAPYCCGETPGLADICLMPQVYNANRWGVQMDDLTRLSGVADACAAHPAFAAAHPEKWQPAA
ncbi:MAG: maleylacetoacetate isomerase [Pseudomonadota bacterium]|nr:maleylacetoacetate isomerase [Pseudomonadota bacterium]